MKDSTKNTDTLSSAIERLQNTIIPDSDIPSLNDDDILYSYLSNLPARECNEECPLFNRCKLKDNYIGKKCPVELIDSLEELKGFVNNVDIEVVDPVTIRRLLEYVALSSLEKQILRELSVNGVAINVPIVGKDSVVATTIGAHPLLQSLLSIIRERGKILEAYIMTPKSKVEAKKTDQSSVLSYFQHIIEAEAETIQEDNSDDNGGGDNDES